MMIRTSHLVSLAVSTVVIGACSAAPAGLTSGSSAAAVESLSALPAVVPLRGRGRSTSAAGNGATVDRRVFVEGDSLTVGIEPYLPTLLAEAGWTATMDEQIGRTTATGVSMIAGRATEIGGTLVVALGTNDPSDPYAFASRIDEVMGIAAGRRVIWVTVARAGWDSLDEALIEAQARWANLHVLDWRPVIDAHPAMQAGDGIHLTQEGYQLRAEFVATAIESAA